MNFLQKLKKIAILIAITTTLAIHPTITTIEEAYQTLELRIDATPINVYNHLLESTVTHDSIEAINFIFNNWGTSTLHMATRFNDYATTCLLLLSGADVNAHDTTQSTPLHIAAENENHQIAQLLILHGAEVHTPNNNGNTPLDIASNIAMIFNNDEFVTLLIQNNDSPAFIG